MGLNASTDNFNCGHIRIGGASPDWDGDWRQARAILEREVDRVKKGKMRLISGTFLEKSQAKFIEILREFGFKRTRYFESRYSTDDPEAIFYLEWKPSKKHYGKTEKKATIKKESVK